MQTQHRVMVKSPRCGEEIPVKRTKERPRRRFSLTSMSVKSIRQLVDFDAGRELWKTKEPKALRPLKT
jgi:hypothetical protein